MRTVQGFLRGESLHVRLKELSDTANEHHKAAMQSWNNWLSHARFAGAALQEAYERLGRRGKWGRWLRANFEGSARTSRDYRRIAREWENPRLVFARTHGAELRSIRSVLRVLAVQRRSTNDNQDATDCEIRQTRTQLSRRISTALRTLNADEVRVFQASFEALWPEVEERLRGYVCVVLDTDYYGEGKANKSAARQRMRGK